MGKHSHHLLFDDEPEIQKINNLKINSMKRLLFYPLYIAFFAACGNTNNTSEAPKAELHLAISREIDLGPLKLEIVPLETTKEALLAGVSHAHIDKENDRIFVLSSFNVYIFDGKGRFVAKLNRGRGPDEVLQVASFSVNPNKKIVCVLDMGRYLKFYDYSGNFLRNIELETFFSMDLHFADDKHLYLVSNYVGGQEDYFVSKYNFEEKKITEKLIHLSNSAYVRSTNLLVSNSFTYNDGNLVFFSPSIFALFEQRDSSMIKVVDLDLGSMLPPLNMANDLILENRSLFAEEIKKRGYVPQLLYAHAFKGFYFIGLDDKDRSCYVINKTKHNEVYSNGPLHNYLGLPEVESLSFPVGNQDDAIVLACNPSDFFNDLNEGSKIIQLGDTILKINASDNPILISVY